MVQTLIYVMIKYYFFLTYSMKLQTNIYLLMDSMFPESSLSVRAIDITA